MWSAVCVLTHVHTPIKQPQLVLFVNYCSDERKIVGTGTAKLFIRR